MIRNPLTAVQGRAEKIVVRRLLALPPSAKRAIAAMLSPRPPVHLDADVRLLLAANEHKPALAQENVRHSRKIYGQMQALLDMPHQHLEVVRDHHVALVGGRAKLREYRPRFTGVLTQAVLFIHGGGFTVGSVETYDNLCRWLADTLDRPVFSLDYRLAPEYPAPAAAQDTLAAWEWLQREALELGVDPEKIAVMGDSAGGSLAAILSQQAKVKPIAQCLIYPTVDQDKTYPSHDTYAEGYGLTRELMDWFRHQYLTPQTDVKDPLISPMKTQDLSGLPPTIMITATDPLRDEGLAYGHRLEQAGVAVTYLDYPHLVHGFASMGGMVPAARRALEDICAALNLILKEQA